MATTYLLDDLCSVYLPAAGLGLTAGTNLFAGLLLDQPDNAVALFEYMGGRPDYVMGNANPLPAMAHPSLQVVVRNTAYTSARSTCESVVRSLETITNTTINTTLYQRIERIQDPFLMHRDNNRRIFFACNLDVTRTPS